MKLKTLFVTAAFSTLSAQAFALDTVATVVRSEPIMQTMSSPERVCHTEQVQRQVRTQGSERSATGSIVGGLAGALLGAQVGGGNGKLAATAAGAIGGAMVGDHVANQNGNSEGGYYTESTPVERCTTVDQPYQAPSGYRVTYVYAGQEYVTTMQRRPGRTIPVEVTVQPKGEMFMRGDHDMHDDRMRRNY